VTTEMQSIVNSFMQQKLHLCLITPASNSIQHRYFLVTLA